MRFIRNRKNIKPVSMSPQAFTLVELLVVISIIALLMSILMPSLGRARDAAKKVTCQSNLKQIAIGFEMYKNDNEGHYPAAVAPEEGKDHYDCLWPSKLIPYIAYAKDEHDHSDSDVMFHCTNKGNARYTQTYAGTQIVTMHDYFSYAMNAQMMTAWGDKDKYYGFYHPDNGGMTHPFTEGEVGMAKGSPSDYVLIFESHGPNLGVRTGTYTHWNTAHVDGSNILNAAGGVEFWRVSPDLHDEYFQDRYQYWEDNYPEYRKRFRGPGYYFKKKVGGRP